MARLFLVRHGETLWNAERRAQGHVDTPLGERGRWQARRLAKRLAAEPLTAVYASDLSRARETAETVAASHQAVSFEALPALREISHGSWEGLTHDQARSRYPDIYARRFASGDETFAPPGGESIADLFLRVGGFTERLRAAHGAEDAGDALVVSHGGTLRALVLLLLGLPEDAFWRFRLALGSVSIVALWPDREATLELWNDVGHLAKTEADHAP